MGQIIASPKVKLITAVMVTPSFPVDEIIAILKNEWGAVDLDMEWYAFDHSHYYDGEFGQSLKKTFLSFDRLVDIEAMPAVKIRTNQIEERYEKSGNRLVNIDPGYVADAKLILPTTKNLSHRIYIGQSIYADQQMMYRGKTFNPMPWTFADYKQQTVIDFFNRVRHRYFEQLKESGTLPVYG